MKEALILAGGLGTRLRAVINDVPKTMAPIQGKPFLAFILDHLSNNGICKVILALGYKYELIQNYFKQKYRNMDVMYSVETSPLGTGGAIKKALPLIEANTILIINGDTFLDIDLSKLNDFHMANSSDITIVLKPMRDYERYGSVSVDKTHRVTGFKEKRRRSQGLINTGFCLLEKKSLRDFVLPDTFSFESDFLEKYCTSLRLYGLPMDVYFIDIGVPEDYYKAIGDLPCQQQ